MHRVPRYLLAVFVVLTSIAPRGTTSAPDPPTPVVSWTVDLREAASGWATVEGTVPAEALPRDGKVRLVFRDATPERGGRVEDVTASVPDYAPLHVETEQTAGGVVCKLLLPPDAASLSLHYRVDPTFYPPGSLHDSPADARSRVTRNLAVLRTTSVWPVGDLGHAHGEVTFLLPEGWSMAWPWAVTDDGRHHLPSKTLSQAEYVVAGALDMQFLKLTGTRCHLARAAGTEGIDLDAMARLIHLYRTWMGGSPRPVGSNYLAAVVPAEFMHGGAAGRFTAVQPPDPHTLAHELFHWWNSGGDFAEDARWFAEGFTEYVSVEAATDTGLLTPADRNAIYADLQAEMVYLERDGVRPLAEISRTSRDEPEAGRLIYAKGAMLAGAMAEALAAHGGKLTDLVAEVVFDVDRPVTSQAIQTAARERYGAELEPFFSRYVFGDESLLIVDFGPATGASGAVRFLPPLSED